MKVGAKVVRHGRYITFQLAEVAVPRELFRKILSLIDDPRPRPAPAWAGGIDSEAKSAGEVRLDDGNYWQIVFRARSNHQYLAVGPLRRQNHSNGDAIWVRSP